MKNIFVLLFSLLLFGTAVFANEFYVGDDVPACIIDPSCFLNSNFNANIKFLLPTHCSFDGVLTTNSEYTGVTTVNVTESTSGYSQQYAMQLDVVAGEIAFHVNLAARPPLFVFKNVDFNFDFDIGQFGYDLALSTSDPGHRTVFTEDECSVYEV